VPRPALSADDAGLARIALATGLALLLLLGWEATGLDLAASRLFADAGGFVWREHWVTARLVHDGGRWLSALVVLALLAGLAWPAAPGRTGPRRPERAFWLFVVLLCLVLVPALKRYSHTSCPWDLAEFGGRVPYVPHWRAGLHDGGPGHCFPSGHAVSAFAFLPQYFLWRTHDRRRAGIWLVVVVLLGFVFGAAQLARGAHFVSHTLWSGWLCWTTGLLATRLAPTSAR